MEKYKKINSPAWTILSTILFFTGALLFIYPKLANHLSQRNTVITIEAFEKHMRILKNTVTEASTVKSVEAPDQEKETLLDKLRKRVEEYNDKIYEEGQKGLNDPFSYEESSIDLSQYGIKEAMFGYIEIPKIKSIMGIYLGATAENMSKGAVHLSQTSLPIGGKNTNAVIAAHRGSRYGDRFLHIDKLETGDEVKITNAWETLIYHVTSTKIIAPNEIEKIRIKKGRDMVTLISCNPYGKNIQRYVVYCDRAADD